MTRVFIDRPPTEKESERLRLLLSTYQDGTGMMQPQGRRQFTLPGWRDFERACAIAFGGHAPESKFYLDVLFPYREEPNVYYGIDCKMRGELGLLARKGRLYVEVVNASKSLWSHLATRGITEANYRDEPACAGASLLEAIDLI
ncbi:MAG: hypothetical protein JW910_18820, partial [Anaerolineae bacterium]|nr:hypothetical protein [Anaerolineae bacterium]